MNAKHERQRDFAVWITRQLTEAGHVAYFAGGCVRDQLLGINPSDYDVATDAGPYKIRDIFGGSRTLMIGEAFGVVCILGKKEFPEQRVEVATFRSDATYSDGRHPDYVTFTDAEHDAQRRDFTINGLFYDPLQDRILDFVGGQQDLANKTLRCIGDPNSRFQEDKLRVLRAVRFAARFDLAIDPNTYKAMCQHAAEIALVSPERIAAELRKMLVLPKRKWAVATLAEAKLFNVFLPQVAAHSTESLWGHTLQRIDNLTPPLFESALATLLATNHAPQKHDELSKEISAELSLRLRLSREEIEGTLFAMTHAKTLAKANTLPWSTVQPLLISKYRFSALSLAAAYEREGECSPGSTAWCLQQCQLPAENLNPPPLLTGDNLQQLGWKPSPKFKDTLAELRQKQLDGELSDKESAVAWLNRGQN